MKKKYFASKNSTTQPNTHTTLWGMGASVSHTHDTLYIKSFSHNVTAAMLVCRKNPKGIELFPNVKHFSLFFQEICIADGQVSEKDLYKYATAGQINLKKTNYSRKKDRVALAVAMPSPLGL